MCSYGTAPCTGTCDSCDEALQRCGVIAGCTSAQPTAAFSSWLGSPNTLTVDVDASASSCGGSACDAYDWDWGDGSAHGTGITASHTYAAPSPPATSATHAITLSVQRYGTGTGSVTKNVTVYVPDYPPVAGATCGWLDANTWTYQIVDSSTDDHGVKQVTANWGDGTMVSSDTTAPFGPLTHTFLNAGTYSITYKVIDTIGQQSIVDCTASPAYFVITGTVYKKDGVTPVPSAVVTAKIGTKTVMTVYTAANGTFSITGPKPATYTLTVSKSGYVFAAPAATMTLGPSSLGSVIRATSP
jgi:hypothetical protein